ncbi:phthiocerol/phthiodiolone dimycocerosyl transferase family protein [Candidatus Lokiarchaeum ossiferum]|uniref:phthiocerol/phthiodiolone dimycocerosyl transferase family protein n=1 Tax=Candidatus Lokiarchaeum ossiferum TaxID=2951803 RepID=UPI00352E385C
MINRPLEFYEAIHAYNCVGLVAFINAKLSKDEIDQAWYFTQLRHPYLRMDLKNDESLPYNLRFQERSALKSIPDNQFYSEIGDITEQSWKLTLQEMTSQSRKDYPELWYLRLRSNQKLTEHQLFFMINHCGSDLIGAFAILDTFLNFLDKILSQEPILDVKSLEFLNIQAHIPPEAIEIPSFNKTRPFLPPLKYQSNLDPNDPAPVSAVWFDFDKEKTERFLIACKKHNVTVQAAISCAEMLGVTINSLSLTPFPHHMLIWIPVNLRPYVTPPIKNEHSVCGTSACMWEQDVDSEMKLWNLVQETTHLIKKGLESKYPLKFRFDVQNQSNIMVEPNPFTCMASSVGNISIRTNYPGFNLLGVKAIAGGYDTPRVSSAGMVAHAYTVQDCFNVTFGYTNPSFSTEWASNFAKIMETFLTILATDKEGNQTVAEFIANISNE